MGWMEHYQGRLSGQGRTLVPVRRDGYLMIGVKVNAVGTRGPVSDHVTVVLALGNDDEPATEILRAEGRGRKAVHAALVKRAFEALDAGKLPDLREVRRRKP